MSIIQQLIEERKKEQAEAEEVRKINRLTAITQAKNVIKKRLASFDGEIVVNYDEPLNSSTTNDGKEIHHLGLLARMRDWQDGVYYFIVNSNGNGRVWFQKSGTSEMVDAPDGGISFESFLRRTPSALNFFARLESNYRNCLINMQEEREQKITSAKKVMTISEGYTNISPVDVEDAYKQLCEVAPEQTAEWNKMLTDWREWHNGRQSAAEKLRADKDAFIAAWASHLKAVAAVKESNLEILRQTQQEMNCRFVTWELAYSCSDDGQLTTDSVQVMYEEPDTDGYWVVLDDDGQTHKEKYFFPVSITRCQHEVNHGRFVYRITSEVLPYDEALLASPWTTKESLARIRQTFLDSLKPLPVPPDPADFGMVGKLDRWQIERLKNRDEEIPF